MQKNCVFCKIVNKEIPSEVIYEDGEFIAFKDINPFGPVSILVIPKKHIETILDLEEKDELILKLFKVGLSIVRTLSLDKKGFAFHINGGGVQEIDHLHLKIGGAWEDRTSKGYPEW